PARAALVALRDREPMGRPAPSEDPGPPAGRRRPGAGGPDVQRSPPARLSVEAPGGTGRLAGQVAFVTGAARGIGQACALALARVIDVTLTGTFRVIQAALPVMRGQGYGKIVTISSISGVIGGAVSRAREADAARRGRSGPAYAAAKGGVIALTKWVAKDVG